MGSSIKDVHMGEGRRFEPNVDKSRSGYGEFDRMWMSTFILQLPTSDFVDS